MADSLSTQPYKGTRDFYPSEMRVRKWIFDRLRTTLQKFGYEEYDGPMLEPFELYAAKTSEEIVNEQLYWMVDRGERKLAVRPEMTPTLARMVAGKQNELPKPIRWYSIPNLWRYERPQRGRLREHWQLNVDVFGGDAFAEDLEICQVIAGIMAGFGAKDGYEVRVNHRGLTNYFFTEVLKVSPEKVGVVARLLDAAGKMGVEAFRAALEKEGLDATQIAPLCELLDQKSAEKIRAQHFSNHADYQHVQKLLETLKELGIGHAFRFDPSIMRGFTYYTGMVLEVYDTHPENNRALFGGGRYDNLVGMFGGAALPGVGFGMGDVTLAHFLETHKLLPDFKKLEGIFVAHLGEEELVPAQKLASKLRQNLTISVCSALEADKPRKIFTTAEKLGLRYVVFVGSEEVKTGKFSVKDMVSGEKTDGDATAIANFVQRA